MPELRVNIQPHIDVAGEIVEELTELGLVAEVLPAVVVARIKVDRPQFGRDEDEEEEPFILQIAMPLNMELADEAAHAMFVREAIAKIPFLRKDANHV